MATDLKAKTLDAADATEWLETAYRKRWTDGLPVVPPTVEKVRAVIDYLGRDSQERLGLIPPRQGIATVEQVAVQCVMAGCKPEHVPVVIAALEAMLEDPGSEGGATGKAAGRRFNLNGVQCTTNYSYPLVIVSGPMAEDLGFATGLGAFNGSRANVTVGRAIRLILWNIGGGYPGEIDMSTYGHQGKLAYCIAENVAASPWEPLHAELGYPLDASVASVLACDAPHDCYVGPAQDRPLQMLRIVAAVAAQLGTSQWRFGDEVHLLVLLSPRVAQALAREGWSKRDVQQNLFDHARRPLRDLLVRVDIEGEDAEDINWPRWLDRDKPEALVPVVRRTEEVHIVVAGGDNDWWCGVLPGWGGQGGWLVSRQIQRSGASSLSG